jgi:hypothetical protein
MSLNDTLNEQFVMFITFQPEHKINAIQRVEMSVRYFSGSVMNGQLTF